MTTETIGLELPAASLESIGQPTPAADHLCHLPSPDLFADHGPVVPIGTYLPIVVGTTGDTLTVYLDHHDLDDRIEIDVVDGWDPIVDGTVRDGWLDISEDDEGPSWTVPANAWEDVRTIARRVTVGDGNNWTVETVAMALEHLGRMGWSDDLCDFDTWLWALLLEARRRLLSTTT